MNEKLDFNNRHAILRLLLNILVYTLIAHIVAAIISYLIGWRLYGDILFWGGAIIIALGLTSSIGNSPSMQERWRIRFYNSASTTQYPKRRGFDKIGGYRSLIISSIVGILTILSGLYIQTL